MKKLFISLLTAALLGGFFVPANAQTGQLPAGNVWGNPGSTQAVAKPTTLTALFNQALCSTQNNVIIRGASVWGCGTLSSLLSQGTGITLSGSTVVTVALSNTAVTAASYGSATQCVALTINAQGQITAASATTCAPAWASITGTPTTLAGYGITSPLPFAQGGCNGTTQQSCFDSAAPTATVTGSIIYWNGTHWVKFDGNTSGTQVFQENASGVPSWATITGTGTVTSVVIAPGNGISVGGTCTITSSGTCTVTNGAAAVTGAVKSNGSGTFTQGATSDLSDVNATAGCTVTDQSGASLSITSTDCKFYQIGKLVFWTFNITYPTTANGATGAISMPVAPYTSLSGKDQTCNVQFPATSAPIAGIISNSASKMQFYNSGAAGTNFTNVSLTTLNIVGSCTYLAN